MAALLLGLVAGFFWYLDSVSSTERPGEGMQRVTSALIWHG